MTILGWISSPYSSYYARTRNSAWTAASMLFLACALSYTRAQAGVTVGADAEYPVRDAREVIAAMRDPQPAAQKAAKAVIERADPLLIEELLRYGLTNAQRERSQKIVAKMGSKAVPALLDLLGSPELGSQAGAVLFQVAGPESVSRVPELLNCLRGKPAVSRYCGDTMIKVCGPKAAGHTTLLSKTLADDDAVVRVYAAAALGRIGAPAKSAVPALIKALGDAESSVRLSAAAALGSMGAAAREAAPALKKAAADPAAEVARAAREALRRTRG